MLLLGSFAYHSNVIRSDTSLTEYLMKRKARLKDIAEALNISTTTVSRALNNKEDISPETKQAVLEVAKMLNYRPNYFAKSLHNSDSHLIGVVVPRVNHSFYSEMIDGILFQAKEKGYAVLLSESMDSNDREQECIEQFLNINIGALIIAPSHNSDIPKGHQIIGIEKKSVVICDRSSDKTLYSHITNDHDHGAYSATMHLINHGRQKIGHIRGLSHDNIADAIYHGYQKAMLQNNLSTYVQQCDRVNPAESYKAAQQLIEYHEVDSFVAVSDEAALGIYRYCFEKDKKIPQDISVIGFSNAKYAQHLTPALSTVDQKSREMGIGAVDLIHSQKTKPFKKDHKTLKTNFINRESSLTTIPT